MGREGPCFHCRIKHTPLWRGGLADKPVLCNACGSRWGKRGTLDDYIPKQGLSQSSKLNLPINENPVMPMQDDINIKSISTGKTEEVQHCPSCSLYNTNNKPRSESQDSSICSCNQMGSPSGKNLLAQHEVTGLPLGIEIPRKKRSVLRQYYLTSTGRLHRQLLQILQAQQSDGATPAADDDLLFMPESAMMTSNGTALGAMLLK